MTRSGPAEPDRLDVVAYYRAAVKAPLLRHAVLPLAERARAHGFAVYVDRHWLHGPHLRVRLHAAAPGVQPDPTRQAGAATPHPDPVPGVAAATPHPGGPAPRADLEPTAQAAAATLRDWIRAHPSDGSLDDATLLAHAAASGRAELIPPPYGPLFPDNTVRVEPVDLAPLRALLGGDGVALRDDLLGLGLPALRASAQYLGEHGDAATARLQLAVAALAAHAANHPGGLVGGHYSYVSHLEDFLVHDDPDGRLRRAFEQHRERAGDAVTALVGRIADGSASRATDSATSSAAGSEHAVAAAWTDWSAAAWRLTETRLASGANLTGRAEEYRARAAATGDAAAAQRWDRQRRTLFSDFHQLMSRADPRGTLWTRRDYLVYRACTNALYRLLAVCDVQPLERYLAAHLVVSAIPALTGHTWHSALTEAAEAAEGAEAAEAAEAAGLT